MNSAQFKVGEQVAVIRTRHGWYDGQLNARVVKVHAIPGGTWRYEIVDQHGNVHEVKQRDLRKA